MCAVTSYQIWYGATANKRMELWTCSKIRSKSVAVRRPSDNVVTAYQERHLLSTNVDTRYSTLCRNNSDNKKYYTGRCLIEPKARGGSVVVYVCIYSCVCIYTERGKGIKGIKDIMLEIRETNHDSIYYYSFLYKTICSFFLHPYPWYTFCRVSLYWLTLIWIMIKITWKRIVGTG